tara:strand:- start:13221 stop:13424 length:204 start_codon:yes stop_codon:yes gene_type:complete
MYYFCDAAGNLATRRYASAEAINTSTGNSAGQIKTKGMFIMLLENGTTVDVFAIFPAQQRKRRRRPS